MKKTVYIAFVSLCAMLLLAPEMAAKGSRERERIVWSKKPTGKSGLYTQHNFFISHGLTLNANALYYFGDVDNEGVAFNGGFNINNLSYGGSLVFGYMMPASTHCNIRYTIMGGTIHGNNEEKFKRLNPPREDFRRFRAVLVQPAVGIEIYPSVRAGFYLYAGVAVTASIVTNYEFFYYPHGSEKLDKITGSTFGILPMVQLGLGYSWRLNESWGLSVELMLQEGLVDQHYMNLDAYPMAANQNSKGVSMGGTGMTYTNRYGEKTMHWNDGWFQLGLTISYRWNTCETCRISNNFYNIKPARGRK
jgi:hypothetical protein